MSYSLLFKYILIGDAAVGKSCLLNVFLGNKYDDNYDITVGIEFGTKHLKV